MYQPPQGQRPQQQPNTQYPPQWQPRPQYPQQPNQPPPRYYYPPQQYYQQVPPVLPPPPPKKKNTVWVVIAVIVGLLFICGLIGQATNPQGGTASTTTTSDAQPTDTPTPTPDLSSPGGIEQYSLQIAQNSSASGSDMSSRYDTGSNSIVITETVGETWDNSTGRATVQSDCYYIEKAVWQGNIPKLKTVEVHIVGPLVDKYGNSSTGPIGICTLNDTTEQKFSWDNLTFDQAWADYDFTWMLPSLLNS